MNLKSLKFYRDVKSFVLTYNLIPIYDTAIALYAQLEIPLKR